MVVTKQLLQQSITTVSNAIGAKFIYLPMHQGNPSWTVISQLHLEVYRTSIYITKNNYGPPRNHFSLILKFNLMLYNHDMKTWLWYQFEGKSSFVSHTKLTAEATFIDLFHSWLITCTMWFWEFENKIAYLGAVKFKTKD